MRRKRVLYVVHNHPELSPGGSEIYALEMYETLKASTDYEPVLLARVGPPSNPGSAHGGVRLSHVNDDPNQYLLYTEPGDFDWFLAVSRNKSVVTKAYRDFVAAIRPDVVHFQHTAMLGSDLIRETRNTAPMAPIVYTLHEFLPICLNHGQMVRPGTNELCSHESPARCHRCYPSIQASEFFLRKRLIQSHFDLADLFLAPSTFLRERYVQWGIDPSRIRVEENGRNLPPPDRGGATRPVRNRFAFFGQLGVYKGLDVLLKAIALESSSCEPEFVPRLSLHGANLEKQPEAFREEVRRLIALAGDRVSVVGRYEQRELPALMRDIDWVVVPSIWWENSPLVIQEAFANKRPVICSDIGGMAEKVTDGVNGLHFRVGDPHALAGTMGRAASTQGLWDKLVAGIPPVYEVKVAARALTTMYDDLLARSERRCVRSGRSSIVADRSSDDRSDAA